MLYPIFSFVPGDKGIFQTFRDFLEVDATFSYNNRKINWTGQEKYDKFTGTKTGKRHRALKGKKNRLNIQSVHAPKPVKKTLSRAAKQAAQGAQYPTCTKNQYQKKKYYYFRIKLDWLSFLLRCLSII